MMSLFDPSMPGTLARLSTAETWLSDGTTIEYSPFAQLPKVNFSHQTHTLLHSALYPHVCTIRDTCYTILILCVAASHDQTVQRVGILTVIQHSQTHSSHTNKKSHLHSQTQSKSSSKARACACSCTARATAAASTPTQQRPSEVAVVVTELILVSRSDRSGPRTRAVPFACTWTVSRFNAQPLAHAMEVAESVETAVQTPFTASWIQCESVRGSTSRRRLFRWACHGRVLACAIAYGAM